MKGNQKWLPFFVVLNCDFRNDKNQIMRQLCLIIQLFFCFNFCAQQNIGYVNYKQLLDSLPSRKEALLKLEMCKKDEYAVLQEMQKEFEVCYLKLLRGCKSLILIQLEEDKLRKQQQDIETREVEIEHLLQNYNEELNKLILERIQKAVEIIAERKKLYYIFDETVTTYFKGGIDCTTEVLVELLKLDAEYMKK